MSYGALLPIVSPLCFRVACCVAVLLVVSSLHGPALYHSMGLLVVLSSRGPASTQWCAAPQHVTITLSRQGVLLPVVLPCHHHTITPGCALLPIVSCHHTVVHCSLSCCCLAVAPSRCGALLPIMSLSHHCARVCCSPSYCRHAIVPGCTAPCHIVYLAVARCCPLCCHCHRIVARDAMTTLLLVLPVVPLLRCCWWCHGSPSVVAAPARLGVGAGASPWHEGVGMVVGASKQNVMSEKIK